MFNTLFWQRFAKISNKLPSVYITIRGTEVSVCQYVQHWNPGDITLAMCGEKQQDISVKGDRGKTCDHKTKKHIADKTWVLALFYNLKLCFSQQKPHYNLHKAILLAQLERTVKNEISCSFTKDDSLQTSDMLFSFELC